VISMSMNSDKKKDAGAGSFDLYWPNENGSGMSPGFSL
jgi:hypothetical protein